jgi:hypothetical protein
MLWTMATVLLLGQANLDRPPVPLWGRWEGTFTAQAPAATTTELSLRLESETGRVFIIDGFWDGGQTWRARFMPTEEGRWRFRTSSKPVVPGLDDEIGTFECHPLANGRTRFHDNGSVRVAPKGRYLTYGNGTPFFWLGDTVWCGPTLSAPEDWLAYLDDRAAKHFSVIQFNLAAPWRCTPADANGEAAFTGTRDIRINPKYYQRLDKYIDAINAHGLVAAPVLIWSLTPKDPGNYLADDDILRLVKYEVARYQGNQVVWILAGDNPYNAQTAERWKRIGRAVFGDRHHAPVTTHPTGMNWPWGDWRGETWLNVLGYQSGHGDDAKTLQWIHSGPVKAYWPSEAVRPIINLEPPYEGHLAYQSKQPHSAANVRRAVYWSLLSAPTAGVTYGAHGLWSWQTQPGAEPADHPGTGIAPTWREALNLPGSQQMAILAELMASLPWWQLQPADGLLAEQPGAIDPARFVAVAKSTKDDAGLAYLPAGGEVALKPEPWLIGLTAEWFDPRTGQRQPAPTAGPWKWRAPDGQDWLLVLRRP